MKNIKLVNEVNFARMSADIVIMAGYIRNVASVHNLTVQQVYASKVALYKATQQDLNPRKPSAQQLADLNAAKLEVKIARTLYAAHKTLERLEKANPLKLVW